jgi:hypothetical protein
MALTPTTTDPVPVLDPVLDPVPAPDPAPDLVLDLDPVLVEAAVGKN